MIQFDLLKVVLGSESLCSATRLGLIVVFEGSVICSTFSFDVVFLSFVIWLSLLLFNSANSLSLLYLTLISSFVKLICLWLRLMIPFGVSIKYDLGYSVLFSNIPCYHFLSLRNRTFVLLWISGTFLAFLL